MINVDIETYYRYLYTVQAYHNGVKVERVECDGNSLCQHYKITTSVGVKECHGSECVSVEGKGMYFIDPKMGWCLLTNDGFTNSCRAWN